ncbi:hypothetical protein B5F07_08125 [Lachnoclostridium sp. An169]|uniref:helix-turn-helix domain-containing protein n=1 Tax=Lachnoclostridium sp. An169 TaxID=1965569 RepID=UPI000B388B58|nr:helix-turn-helix domain-containing protein [Lachnoclostridium sp. An169]OUP84419.1 hypothetical protein B5F07_08125 [Lachnoclostridium sp. An169]
MSKWKVLVVDDEMEIAEYIGSLVEETIGQDAEIEVLYSGTRAKKRLEEEKVDLLLTDLVMPVTDGFQLLEYAAENCPEMEVILLTAYEEFEYIYRANKIRPCSYVVKAEKESVICRKIEEAANRIRDSRSRRDTVEHARKQIEEVKQIFSEEKVKQMITYEEYGESDQSERQMIEIIKNYIREHRKEDLTAASIAEVFHYSPAYLSKIFRIYGKEKLSVYIMRQKLSEAKRMLVETDQTVQSIAGSLGYQSPQAFARAFRRELGVTPQEYRRDYGRRKEGL